MKKLTVLFLAVIGALVFALSGCSNNDTFTEKSYSSGETEIEKIILQATDREVEISASDDNQIYIDYFDGKKEYLDISVSESKELTVKLVFDKDWKDYIGTKPSAEYRKIKIVIPDNLISTLSVNTTNENIKVNSLSFTENISLDTNGGNIICERVSVGKSINLKAKDGNITGSIIGGWDDFSISCTIKKGDCNLPELKEGGEKSFAADCNNGNISIEFVK
ncbi:MAG: DUF4097 family beta strand repeat protein [Clostridia bacterium]|nr:DUF4097 family beta strand repeat protein [Clostridia bacterium]